MRAVERDTADRILDVAERLVQTRGFNGFSYADIAGPLGVTKASLHYHFPSKAELGRRLVERYHERFFAHLDAIDRGAEDGGAKLERYAGIYVEVLREDRMCLCGMLAADFETLPDAMKARVRAFFDANERWLAGTLDRGRRRKELSFHGAPEEAASLLVSSLEGAMLIARSHGDAARFERVVQRLVEGLRARSAAE